MTVLRSRRFRRAGLLFAGIFVFAVVTQLGVGWYQRRAGVRGRMARRASGLAQNASRALRIAPETVPNFVPALHHKWAQSVVFSFGPDCRRHGGWPLS
jgi:hypothetical protein